MVVTFSLENAFSFASPLSPPPLPHPLSFINATKMQQPHEATIYRRRGRMATFEDPTGPAGVRAWGSLALVPETVAISNRDCHFHRAAAAFTVGCSIQRPYLVCRCCLRGCFNPAASVSVSTLPPPCLSQRCRLRVCLNAVRCCCHRSNTLSFAGSR